MSVRRPLSALALLAALAGCAPGGEVYRSPELGFAITHPPDAEIQRETPRHVKFTVLGPDNAPATEITDGFTLTVHRDAAADPDAGLEAYAKAVLRQTEAAGEEILAAPEPTSIGGHAAMRLRHRTALGNAVTTYLFAPEPGGHYRVTAAISGEGYDATVEDMLESLSFMAASVENGGAATVRLALLKRPADGTEPDAGCDALVYESFRAKGDTPLAAALDKLFALDAERVRGRRHFLARTNDTLRLERAEREGGTARIYLAGELTGLRGVCDDPRAAIQIRHTALQVEGVERVELYLNGEATDLIPDARGGNGASLPRSKA